MTAGNLHDFCKKAERLLSNENVSQSDFSEATYCIGYFKGITAVLRTACYLYKHKRIPSNEITADLGDITISIKMYLKWIDDNPKSFGEIEELAVRVLRDEFPCKR